MAMNDQPTNPQPPMQDAPAPAAEPRPNGGQPRPRVLPEHQKYVPRPAAQEPADQQQEPTEQEQQRPADFALKLPDLPVNKLPENYQESLDAYTEAASSAGLDGRTAQRLLNSIVESALDFPYEKPLTTEDAATEMESRWGSDYARRITVVQRAVDGLGDGFKTFLDETGYGNSAPVLEALYRYASGELTLTKAEAEKKLDKIMQDPKHPYWSQGLGQHERKRLTAEVRFLNAVIHEGVEPERPSARPPKPSAQETAKSDARAEASKMIRDGVFTNGTPKEREAATKRFLALTSKL